MFQVASKMPLLILTVKSNSGYFEELLGEQRTNVWPHFWNVNIEVTIISLILKVLIIHYITYPLSGNTLLKKKMKIFHDIKFRKNQQQARHIKYIQGSVLRETDQVEEENGKFVHEVETHTCWLWNVLGYTIFDK